MKPKHPKKTNSNDWNGNHKIAVYGTLKRGHGNHWRLEDCTFLGDHETSELFPLIVDGLPYLVDKPGTGHHVKVEVYRVDDPETRDALDKLEGHPHFYQRRQIEVEGWAGTLKAWVYLVPESRVPINGHRLHSVYRQQR